MHIISRKILLDFSTKYLDAGKPLVSWWTICKKNNFASFDDLKKIFGTADIVGKCVIFNIGGGKYRLVVRVNFSAHRMWIKSTLSLQKSEGFRAKAPRVKSRSKPTANPWQRRIWSPPAFPQGKQHSIK